MMFLGVLGSIFLLGGVFVAGADEGAGGSTPVTDTAASVATATTASSSSPALLIPGGDVPLQETQSVQETLSGGELESTVNPSTLEATSTPTLPLESEASTTPQGEAVPEPSEPLAPPPVAASLPPVSPPVPPSPVPSTPAPALSSVVAAIDREALTPDDEYVVTISEVSIATKRKTSWNNEHLDKKKESSTKVIDTPVAVVESATEDNVFVVSGACQAAYFVVLVYKNKEDYDQNPSSYIVNKAFDCVNGQYSYAINTLPSNLADGSYYLLIGEEGESGSWAPVTALREITLKRNY